MIGLRARSGPAEVGADLSVMKRRPPVDQGMAARLRQARALAGYDSPSAAIQALGPHTPWSRGYFKLESGERSFAHHALTLARAYDVSLNWLVYDIGAPKSDTMGRVVRAILQGHIGPLGVISDAKIRDLSDDERIVNPPPLADADIVYSVYINEGDQNYPALRDGDALFLTPPEPPENLIGECCVCRLKDGSKRVAILTDGTHRRKRHFTLNLINAPPLPNVEVVDAQWVAWIQRRRPQSTA
jgi:hypothetical protein